MIRLSIKRISHISRDGDPVFTVNVFLNLEIAITSNISPTLKYLKFAVLNYFIWQYVIRYSSCSTEARKIGSISLTTWTISTEQMPKFLRDGQSTMYELIKKRTKVDIDHILIWSHLYEQHTYQRFLQLLFWKEVVSKGALSSPHLQNMFIVTLTKLSCARHVIIVKHIWRQPAVGIWSLAVMGYWNADVTGTRTAWVAKCTNVGCATVTCRVLQATMSVDITDVNGRHGGWLPVTMLNACDHPKSVNPIMKGLDFQVFVPSIPATLKIVPRMDFPTMVFVNYRCKRCGSNLDRNRSYVGEEEEKGPFCIKCVYLPYTESVLVSASE